MRALTFPLIAALTAGPALAHAAVCDPVDPTTAEVNAREGVRLAKAGKFAEAVPLFRIAVRLDACAPEHQLLLARGLFRSGNRAEAQERYEAVLKGFPKSMAAKRARKELDEMNATPEEVPGVANATGDTLAPKDPGPPWDVIGYSAAGVGVALIGAGVYFAMDAQGADDDLQTAARQPNRAKYDDLVDQRDSSTTLAYVMYGVGGVALVGGLVTALVVPGLMKGDAGPGQAKPGDASATTGFAPLPEGGGLLTLGGTF
ncbi:MAG: hypothetical protein KC613_06210 [Myxococcales bacterium]|nr:hypothetical protein [Myxococcales bacterium]MCB9523430.1 hypothetical protein [Myxococcales bacterium]